MGEYDDLPTLTLNDAWMLSPEDYKSRYDEIAFELNEFWSNVPEHAERKAFINGKHTLPEIKTFVAENQYWFNPKRS
jgi:hypothetical protein